MNDKIKNIRERVRISEEILYKNALEGKINFGLMLNDIKYLLNENDNLLRKLQEKICIEAHEQVKQLYISKEKVKNKLKEVENGTFDAKIVLQSLLEEE